MRETKKGSKISLAELLLEEDDEFVEAAYLALLKRRPDATGGRAYLQALRNGTSKLQILRELSISDDCKLEGGEIPGLAEAMARERIGVVPTAPAQTSQITRADQLLAISGDESFIEFAYWILLLRAPDPDGMASYHARLQAGASKVQVLYEIFTSSECRAAGVELDGLRQTFAQEHLGAVGVEYSSSQTRVPLAANSLKELLGHDIDGFVDLAHATLFKRLPTEAEAQHRLGQLLDGFSKIHILSEMAASNKAIAAKENLPGLSTALTRYALSQTPITGRIMGFILGVEGNSEGDFSRRAAEQRFFASVSELRTRVQGLAESIGEVSGKEIVAIATRKEVDVRIGSLEESALLLRQLFETRAQLTSPASPSPDSCFPVTSGQLILRLRAGEIARDLRHVH